MTVTLLYGISTGQLDPGGDPIDYEVDLTPTQESDYKRALMTGKEFEDFEELRELINGCYEEIEYDEIENLLEYEDEFCMECMGYAKVDPDEINDLVQSGDEHAIKYFKLDRLNPEELEEWDANDLENLPKIADFNEDFEPESPFDNGWKLNVWFFDPRTDEFFEGKSYPITKESIIDYLKEALKAGDFSLVNEVLKAQEDFFSEQGEDIKKTVLQLAEKLGLREYTSGQ